MAKPVTHLCKIVQRKTHSVTTTACNRMACTADGINSTDIEAQVTCKLCIRQMAYQKQREAA